MLGSKPTRPADSHIRAGPEEHQQIPTIREMVEYIPLNVRPFPLCRQKITRYRVVAVFNERIAHDPRELTANQHVHSLSPSEGRRSANRASSSSAQTFQPMPIVAWNESLIAASCRHSSISRWIPSTSAIDSC